jgi:DNA ligase-associated metallophosphoesterase
VDGTQTIVIENQPLVLLPQRMVFWPAQRMLILADPHFGKAALFRRRGIAIPAGTTAADLQRLKAAITATGTTRVLILGDLVHAREATDELTIARISRWQRHRKRLKWSLVRGNHDWKASRVPATLGFEAVHERLTVSPFTFAHQPDPCAGTYVVGGHLHPAVQLAGPGRQHQRLPCFIVGHKRAILPAFGSFTGNATVYPKVGEQIFAIAEEQVIAI